MYSYKPTVGDTVTYAMNHPAIVAWGGNDNPTMLTIGEHYTVESVEVHSSHTKVTLQGVVGNFNSSHFVLA